MCITIYYDKKGLDLKNCFLNLSGSSVLEEIFFVHVIT